MWISCVWNVMFLMVSPVGPPKGANGKTPTCSSSPVDLPPFRTSGRAAFFQISNNLSPKPKQSRLFPGFQFLPVDHTKKEKLFAFFFEAHSQKQTKKHSVVKTFKKKGTIALLESQAIDMSSHLRASSSWGFPQSEKSQSFQALRSTWERLRHHPDTMPFGNWRATNGELPSALVFLAAPVDADSLRTPHKTQKKHKTQKEWFLPKATIHSQIVLQFFQIPHPSRCFTWGRTALNILKFVLLSSPSCHRLCIWADPQIKSRRRATTFPIFTKTHYNNIRL